MQRRRTKPRSADKNVNIVSLAGVNRDFILNHIPHISTLMVSDVDAVLKHAETVAIGNRDPDFSATPERLVASQVLVNFVQIIEGRSKNGKYDSICW